MKRLFILAIACILYFYACQDVKKIVGDLFGPNIIEEAVTKDNEKMVCLVTDLVVRYVPEAGKEAKRMASLNRGDVAYYLGEKCNLEERPYAETFPKQPMREDYWYKVRFVVTDKKSRHKGKTWIGWVHGGGMQVVPQKEQEQQPVYAATANQPPRYAVVVGVSDYDDASYHSSSIDLRFADDDAMNYYSFLRSPAGGSLPESNIALLTDDDATVQNILDKCNEIYSKAGRDAIIIFYFSGHGSERQFLAYDKPLYHNDLKYVLKNSVAARKLVIADACYSGTIIPDTAPSEDEFLTYQKPDEYGIAFFTAGGSEVVIERQGGGVFTKALIDGFSDCSANENNDNTITIAEIETYVKKALANENQTPQLGGTFNHQMPIATCGSEDVFFE